MTELIQTSDELEQFCEDSLVRPGLVLILSSNGFERTIPGFAWFRFRRRFKPFLLIHSRVLTSHLSPDSWVAMGH
ncbi:MAG: hypothetical protein CM1200mP18_17330 [Gammaproteobacteria bacterium]|nr:MAG: hypothetical protein CM1200mP18_17330 [Gammaproteobacteria bacterium]